MTVLVVTAWQYRCDGCHSTRVTAAGQARPSGWSAQTAKPDDRHYCPACTRDRELVTRALRKGYPVWP